MGFIRPFNTNKLRTIGFITGLYICAWALFLRRTFPSAKKAIIGYDVLFPKYVSGAMTLAGIETHAIQERMTLIRTKIIKFPLTITTLGVRTALIEYGKRNHPG